MWLSTFISALPRAVADRRFHNTRSRLLACLEGACIGCAIIFVSAPPGDLDWLGQHCVYWLGASILLGTMGKDITVLRRRALSAVFNFEASDEDKKDG